MAEEGGRGHNGGHDEASLRRALHFPTRMRLSWKNILMIAVVATRLFSNTMSTSRSSGRCSTTASRRRRCLDEAAGTSRPAGP